MNYLNSLDFLKDRDTYDDLGSSVKELTNASKADVSPATKISILEQLIVAISQFDSHLRNMIEKYPDYYTDFKDHLDRILKADGGYLLAARNEIENIKRKQLN